MRNFGLCQVFSLREGIDEEDERVLEEFLIKERDV